MSTGQLVFCGGLILLGLTIITTVLFLVKRPKYLPENAACKNTEAGYTQRLQNGHQTKRETIHQGSTIEPAETELLPQETASIFQSEETEILPSTEKI